MVETDNIILQILCTKLKREKRKRKEIQPLSLRATSVLIRAVSVVSVKSKWRLHHVLA